MDLGGTHRMLVCESARSGHSRIPKEALDNSLEFEEVLIVPVRVVQRRCDVRHLARKIDARGRVNLAPDFKNPELGLVTLILDYVAIKPRKQAAA
jgi:hypothetical protein